MLFQPCGFWTGISPLNDEASVIMEGGPVPSLLPPVAVKRSTVQFFNNETERRKKRKSNERRKKRKSKMYGSVRNALDPDKLK